ncbi:MAG: tetratricopeptide repeat protein [Gammaproteobacteria bacterium]|nr:tetratricopeptide repeat protein [Gammaproteobacteria bacterium]
MPCYYTQDSKSPRCNTDDAIVDLRTVLRDDPGSVKALGMMGQLYAAQNLTALAIEAYSKALALGAESSTIANAYANVLLRSNKPSEAHSVLLDSLRRGNKSIQTIKILTQVKLMLGDWQGAEKLAQQLRDVKGEEAISEHALGLVYQGLGQPDKSIDAFRRAHELAPEADESVIALVQALVKDKRLKEARQFLQKIVSEDDSSISATRLLAQLSLLENDIPTAIGYFASYTKIKLS